MISLVKLLLEDDSVQSTAGGQPLPEPSEEDIEKYDLGIQDYAAEEDMESQDYSIE